MSEKGTVYLLLPSPRSTLLPSLAKYLNLDIKVSNRDDPSYKAAFPLNKAPAYASADGWKLHEAMAILEYFISQKPKSCIYPFYGSSDREKAEVWQWVSFANSDCVIVVCNYLYAKTEDVKKAALAKVLKCADEFEVQLKKSPYLVGNKSTLADIFAAQWYIWVIQVKLFNKDFFQSHPATATWYRGIVDTDPIVSPDWKGFAPKN